MVVDVHGVVSLKIISDGDEKPYLEIMAGDITLNITTNVAEMIGGIGEGARLRYEDQLKKGK